MDEEDEHFTKNEQFRRVAECCIIFSLLITPIACVIIIVQTSDNVVSKLTIDSRWFLSTGSESCIRLMDINGDGLDDILVALTEVTAITNEIEKDKNRPRYCQSLNVETPCSGTVYGIRGYDFSILWSFRVKQSIFELVCDKIDIDDDGYRDCIGTGRQATLVAFDPRNGKIFWQNENIKSRRSLWNFYNPIVLPVDVDHDHMNDILISHGGNPTIPSNVHEREAGCLIIISSRNGNQIGEPFWMPDGKETYMSPVLYGNSTILFGTGGETVPGGLYSISLENILEEKNRYITIMYSQVIIIDGLTGETLWTKNNSFGEFTSPLTLQMKNNGKYQDAFIYRQRGQTSESIDFNPSSILFHGIGLQDGEILSVNNFK